MTQQVGFGKCHRNKALTRRLDDQVLRGQAIESFSHWRCAHSELLGYALYVYPLTFGKLIGDDPRLDGLIDALTGWSAPSSDVQVFPVPCIAAFAYGPVRLRGTEGRRLQGILCDHVMKRLYRG